MPLDRLAYIQGQRYWVERALQDAKRHSGLGDYQVRGWVGWHHHMAIVLMAMLFMIEERVRHSATVHMLSTADIEKLLKHYLPRRDTTEQELFRLLPQLSGYKSNRFCWLGEWASLLSMERGVSASARLPFSNSVSDKICRRVWSEASRRSCFLMMATST